MSILRNRTTAIAVALLMVLSMAIALLALPAEKHYATAQITTWPFIGAIPNPANVGQDVLLHVGITASLGSVGMGWEDLSVTIERPDGETDTIEDITTDSTGGTGRMYVPDMAGEYIVQTHFPEQLFGIITYLASDSPKLTFVAQEEPLTFYPGHCLPNFGHVSGLEAERPDQWFTFEIRVHCADGDGVALGFLATGAVLFLRKTLRCSHPCHVF